MGRRDWIGLRIECREMPVRRGGEAAFMVEVNPKANSTTQRKAKRLYASLQA